MREATSVTGPGWERIAEIRIRDLRLRLASCEFNSRLQRISWRFEAAKTAIENAVVQQFMGGTTQVLLRFLWRKGCENQAARVRRGVRRLAVVGCVLVSSAAGIGAFCDSARAAGISSVPNPTAPVVAPATSALPSAPSTPSVSAPTTTPTSAAAPAVPSAPAQTPPTTATHASTATPSAPTVATPDVSTPTATAPTIAAPKVNVPAALDTATTSRPDVGTPLNGVPLKISAVDVHKITAPAITHPTALTGITQNGPGTSLLAEVVPLATRTTGGLAVLATKVSQIPIAPVASTLQKVNAPSAAGGASSASSGNVTGAANSSAAPSPQTKLANATTASVLPTTPARALVRRLLSPPLTTLALFLGTPNFGETGGSARRTATPRLPRVPLPRFPLNGAAASGGRGGSPLPFAFILLAFLLVIPTAVRWLRPALALGLSPAYVAIGDRPG